MNVSLKPDVLQKINALRDIYANDFRRFAHDCLVIRTKTNGVQPFVLNSVQLDFLARFEKQIKFRGLARFIVLKARQMGLSTLIEALMYWWAIFHSGFKGLVLTHLDSATQELFEMTRRYHNNVPEPFRPKAHNDSSHELTFRGIESAIKTATAGSKNAGHGSTFQGLHWSEVSRSPNQDDIVAGVLQTVPDGAGSLIFLESTANGVGDFFHETWQAAVRGENDYEPVFYAWFEMAEYRRSAVGIEFTEEELDYQALFGVDDEQLAWRRYTINNKMGKGSFEKRLNLFKEQYPSTAEEAFRSDENSFIAPESVELAMRSEYEPVGAVVIGLDPARQGRDHTGVVVRQGRKVRYVGRWKLDDTMMIVGRVVKLFDEFQADCVFVDAIGVGAGVYDRLRELGYKAEQAIVSKRADKEHTYVNKRAEIWADMAEWLDNGADLPDSHALRDDLLLLGYAYDSSNRLKMQSKKNLARSPDLGDALALTFYAPVVARQDDELGLNYGKKATKWRGKGGAKVRV